MIFKKTPIQQLYQLLLLVALGTLISCSSTQQLSEKPITAINSAAAKTTNPFLKGLSQAEIIHIKDEAWRYYGHQWKTITQRSRYVRQPLLETLQRYNYPTALQLIPVVESGYNTYAESEVGATGLWQLMPLTAKDLKVTSNQYFDGRRDIKLSTRAAGQYLSHQYRRFGNWQMAFAAYHLGPTAVQRRLNKRAWQPEDGLSAMPLPYITKTYIRHILGLIALEEEGRISFPEPHSTISISIQTPIDLNALQKKIALTNHQLFRFNPELNLARYLEKGPSEISLRIPKSSIKSMQRQVKHAPAAFIPIAVKANQHLSKISKSYNLSMRTLLSYNPGSALRSSHDRELRLPVDLLKDAPETHNPLKLI